MASPFETIINNLQQIGAFQFLFPFLLTSAIFYGLLRRSQIFGKPEQNVAVNAVVAIVAAFMVLGYPILAGVNIQVELSKFFFGSVVSILTIVVGLMILGAVVPGGIGEEFAKRWKGGGMAAFLVFGILVAIGILASTGLINVFFPTNLPFISTDVILTIAILFAMVISVGLIAYLGGRGETPAKKQEGGG